MRYLHVAAASSVPLMLASACSGGQASAENEDAPAAVVRVAPQDGAGKVAPENPVTVAAQGGTLESVTLAREDGKAVSGVLSPDETQWRSRWALRPGEKYTVSAVAVNPSGKSTRSAVAFSTMDADQSFRIKDVTPNEKEKVGTGMPIIVNFDRKIRDRAEVERALEVRMKEPVEGAWSWIADDRVDFRPKEYWPKGQEVEFVAHLSGVREGPGTYGTKDLVRKFSVPRAQESTINVDTHQMTVKRDGKKIRQIPISAGKGGSYRYMTTNGKHLAMAMEPHVLMTSAWMGVAPGSPGGYSLDVYNTVRISDTGEYVHGAPWSVGSQGYANVSHGCVNASPSNARWYMGKTLRGDPVNVKGSPRQVEHMNGWTHWEMSWKEWLEGSALKASMNTPGAVPEEKVSGPVPAAAD